MTKLEKKTRNIKRALMINNIICYILLGVSAVLTISGYCLNIIIQQQRTKSAGSMLAIYFDYCAVLMYVGLLAFVSVLVYKCVFKKIALYYIDSLNGGK